MSTMTTYSPAYGAAAHSKAAAQRKSFFQRFLHRMIEARMRRADEFIQRHSYLIPRELEQQVGWKLTERSEDSLPFVR